MKKTVIVLSLLAFVGLVYSQPRERADGLILDEDITAKIPKRATLTRAAAEDMPVRYSLKKYAPSVGDQGPHGTCTAWASAYAARTIAEAVANGWTDKTKINGEAYSAVFLYSLIHDPSEKGCCCGSSIGDALLIMDSVGVAKMGDIASDNRCPVPVSYKLLSKARERRLDKSLITFAGFSDASSERVKKAVSQNRPVIIGMRDYRESFMKEKGIKGGIWNGDTSGSHGNHAMCVVGYDDDLAGGAFEIMNSWGDDWANGGFVWVRYRDFNANAYYGAEVYVRPNADRMPKTVSLSGSLQFKERRGKSVEDMPAVLQNRGGVVPTYRMTAAYVPGTKFQIYLSNNGPAYVYVVGSDLINNTRMRFPPDDRTNAALFYDKNEIAIPGEKSYLPLDATEGTTYCLVLYSRDELPISDIVNKIFNGSGDFAKRAAAAVVDTAGNSLLVPPGDMSLERGSIKFSSKSAASVVAIAVEIDVRNKN